MRVPQERFRVPNLYGDNNWHSYNVDPPLSLLNPMAVTIGVTTVLPSHFIGSTKIKSNWLWRYGFGSSSSGRYYSTSTGSNGTTGITSLNVNVTSTSTYYPVGEGNTVEEAYRTEGTNIIKNTISTIRFSSYNSFYFTPTQSTTPEIPNRAIVCRFLAEYEADLPTDMYQISSDTITWNMSHPVCVLLNGKDCTPY